MLLSLGRCICCKLVSFPRIVNLRITDAMNTIFATFRYLYSEHCNEWNSRNKPFTPMGNKGRERPSPFEVILYMEAPITPTHQNSRFAEIPFNSLQGFPRTLHSSSTVWHSQQWNCRTSLTWDFLINSSTDNWPKCQ